MDNVDSLDGCYVVVEFLAGKSTYHYLGQVLSEEKSDDGRDMVQVNFMRSNRDKTFSFPKNEDKSWHFMSEIKQVLGKPEAIRRSTNLFNDLNFSNFNIR